MAMSTWRRKTAKGLVALGMALISLVVLRGIVAKNTDVSAPSTTTQEVPILEKAEAQRGQYEQHHIVLADTSPERAKKIAEAVGAELRITETGSYAVLDLGSKDVAEVLENVQYQEYLAEMSLDYYGTFCASGSESGALDHVLDDIHMADTWSQTKGKGSVIAVIDSGIDIENAALSGKISDRSFNASEGKTVKDYSKEVVAEGDTFTYHGTRVASAIAADYEEKSGIGGIAPEDRKSVV